MPLEPNPWAKQENNSSPTSWQLVNEEIRRWAVSIAAHLVLTLALLAFHGLHVAYGLCLRGIHEFESDSTKTLTDSVTTKALKNGEVMQM